MTLVRTIVLAAEVREDHGVLSTGEEATELAQLPAVAKELRLTG